MSRAERDLPIAAALSAEMQARVKLENAGAGHTPGPWELDLESDGAFWISVPPVRDMQDPITIAKRGPWAHRAQESHANARLIAAAPELLDALQAVVDAAGPEAGPEIGQAAAAIARATGATP